MSAPKLPVSLVRLSILCLLALVMNGVRAETIVIPATGAGVSVPPGGTDANWQVVALPTLYTGTVPPYQAFVFSGTGAGAVPGVWLGGESNAGAEGARWIGVKDVPASLFPSAPLSGTAVPPQVPYTMIFAHAFTAATAGPVDFSFWAAADNRVEFFLNGTVTSGSMTPFIDGGTPIGTGRDGFGRLNNFSATGVNVGAGTNYLYAVVTDRFTVAGDTGGWGDTGLIVSPVPEPSTMILAAAGVAGIVAARLRRRRASRS